LESGEQKNKLDKFYFFDIIKSESEISKDLWEFLKDFQKSHLGEITKEGCG